MLEALDTFSVACSLLGLGFQYAKATRNRMLLSYPLPTSLQSCCVDRQLMHERMTNHVRMREMKATCQIIVLQCTPQSCYCNVAQHSSNGQCREEYSPMDDH